MDKTYDEAFMRYTNATSTYAAETVVAYVKPALNVSSVLDVGCAAGAWLKAWSAEGVDDFVGVDGDYVDLGMLEIPADRFRATDLDTPLDLGRQFDLVQSLEVGEHIDPAATDVFVETLTRHADRFILFSAAPPGQGGENHCNERSFEDWRMRFEERGFTPVDAIRPQIARDLKISYWYRYNIFLYVRRSGLDALPAPLRALATPPSEPLADVSPAWFKLRKVLVRRLPYGVQNRLAKLKSRFLPSGRV